MIHRRRKMLQVVGAEYWVRARSARNLTTPTLLSNHAHFCTIGAVACAYGGGRQVFLAVVTEIQ